MKTFNHSFFYLFLVIFSLVVASCAKTEDKSETDPLYVGDWERTWFSNDQEVFYTQTLTLEEANYFSNIWIKNEDELIPFVSSEGVYTVIDNTLTGQFISFGKANENNQMVYYNSSSNDVSLQVIEKLNIHPNFIGTFFTESNSLTLSLDMDGDGSISGDEGKFVFKRIVH